MCNKKLNSTVLFLSLSSALLTRSPHNVCPPLLKLINNFSPLVCYPFFNDTVEFCLENSIVILIPNSGRVNSTSSKLSRGGGMLLRVWPIFFSQSYILENWQSVRWNCSVIAICLLNMWQLLFSGHFKPEHHNSSNKNNRLPRCPLKTPLVTLKPRDPHTPVHVLIFSAFYRFQQQKALTSWRHCLFIIRASQ
jgi:hypothetical protein